MQHDRPALARLLVERSAGHTTSLYGRTAAFRLHDVARGSSLGDGRAAAAGRAVLLLTATQEAAALALIELDGVARRIVIAPPDLDSGQLAAVVADAEVECILTDKDPESFMAASLPPSGLPPSGLPPVLPCGLPQASAEPLVPDGLDTEWVMLTSGTTGAPKMVIHSRAALTGAIKPLVAEGRPTVWATFYDIRRYGGLQIFLRAILGDASMVLSCAGEAVADHLLRLGAHGVTHISGTPSHWRRALMSPESAAIAPDYVRLSGEIADQAILDSLRKAYPKASVGHAYASTEAGVGFEVTDGREGFPADYLGRRGAVEMKVEDGSLRIRSSRTASRYLAARHGSEGASAPRLADAEGFVDTDDMVELRGDRYHFVGRRSGIINVGGLKVHPEEVEAVINRHDKVRMSLVKARANPITGAVVVADVVLKDAGPEPAASAVLKDEILKLCRQSLAYHKVPVLLRFIPALAVTPAGKLSRAHA